LEFKNIILEEKLSNKFKNGHEKFLASTIFEFCGQFFFQNEVFKLQKDFPELVLRLFLEKRICEVPGIFYFTHLRQTRGAKKFPKTN
jgi:hypothetical protein